MPRHEKLADEQLFQVAIYLGNPCAKTDIHAEMRGSRRAEFEAEYARATNGYPLPEATDSYPYYIWQEGTNKYGMQLRIYFARVPPEPAPIKTLYTDHGKWYRTKELYRINHTNLVMQLFECGFVLGDNSQNSRRIKKFMKRRFPVE